VGKKENVRARNGGAGKRGATTMARAAWPEARQFGGSTTLVEEEEGLAWWWRVAETIAERETLSNRSDDWPEQRGRRRDATVAAQRWQYNDVAGTVVERGGGDAERVREKKRGSHFYALIKLYGLGSIDNRGI